MQVSGSLVNNQITSTSNVKPQQPSNTQTQSTTESPQNTQLAPQDTSNVNNKLTGKQESKFDPSGFKFDDKNEPKYETVNPLVNLAAAVISIVGGASGASYDPNLGESVQKGLNKSAEFTGKHGLSDDFTINPFGGMRSKIEQPSKEEEAAQRNSNQKSKEESNKMVNQQIANQQS